MLAFVITKFSNLWDDSVRDILFIIISVSLNVDINNSRVGDSIYILSL